MPFPFNRLNAVLYRWNVNCRNKIISDNEFGMETRRLVNVETKRPLPDKKIFALPGAGETKP